MLHLQHFEAYMLNFIHKIKNIPLFDGIREDEINHLLTCLDAKAVDYEKGSFVWLQGEENYKVGIVLFGRINIIKEDIMGSRSLIAALEPPQIFGESMAGAEADASPVSVQAAMNSKVLLIDFLKLVRTCEASCAYHSLLVQNMMKIIARKNMYLNEKIDYLKRTTIRQKVAAYIINHVKDKDALTAHLPLNREELADYLGVNRSALSRELSCMKRDALISYKKNDFEIIDYLSITKLAS